MDISDLSRETIESVIDVAEYFHHDLSLQFINLLEDSNDDDEFLSNSINMISGWAANYEWEFLIEDVFVDDLPDKDELEKTLGIIFRNISTVSRKQMKNRSYGGYDY